MSKLFRGEIYRIFHKLSFYIYFGALFAFYLALTFVRSGGIEENSIVVDLSDVIGAFPVLAGGYLFVSFYADDLSSKSLTTLVGFGIDKAKIILVKFILTAAFCTLLSGLFMIAHCAVYSAFGFPPTPDSANMIFAIALHAVMSTLMYTVIASIAVYALQRVTFAVVTYFLLSLNIIGGLLKIIFQQLNLMSLIEHIPSDTASNVMAVIVRREGNIAPPLIEYLAFVAVFLILSVIAFNTKEMEF